MLCTMSRIRVCTECRWCLKRAVILRISFCISSWFSAEGGREGGREGGVGPKEGGKEGVKG